MTRLLASLLLASSMGACSATMPDAVPYAAEAPLVTPMPSAPIADDARLTRIAFGSCLKEEDDMSIWNDVLEADPDLFLFIGDNVYGDPWRDDPEALDPLMPKMIRSYNRLAERAAFATFRQQVPVMTTWDDHDYGANDAGAEFPFKVRAQALYNDAWAIPARDPRRQRPGVYTSRTFGPNGQRVQVILLDTRYFRGALTKTDEYNAPGKERYVPSTDTSSTMLGEAQWAWLEATLREPADLRLLVSSIQVHADGHGWEAWATLPHERQRLYDMLAETGASNTVLLSGDRHAGSIYERTDVAPFPIREVTASSLNAPVSAWIAQDIARGRPPRPTEAGPHRVFPMQQDANFGLIDIDWDTREASLQVVEPGGETYRVSQPF